MKLKILFSLLFLGFAISCSTSEKDQRPNIIFIAVDDLRPELGVYGADYMVTPNIDQLGSQGMVFLNHYVQVPTCGASRHALLTGMRPTKKSHLSNNASVAEFTNLKETAVPETFIEAFKNSGYHTVGIGKISHSADGLVYGYTDEPSTQQELPNSWSELLFNSGKWKTGWNSFFAYANGENRQSMKRQVKPYEKGAVDDKGYPDGLTTELAISKLQELKSSTKPFFMGIGFFKPHLPFNAPKKYWDLYDIEKIDITNAPNIPENTSKKHLINNGEFNGYQLTDEKLTLNNPASTAYAKKLKHAYYAAVSYTDAQIGKVLQELKNTEQAENTIVVIWGDHGWNLGDHRVWGKHTLYDRSLKSALLVYDPRIKSTINSTKHIVESIDIYPTLLELCNISPSYPLDGTSFVTSLENPLKDQKSAAYSYYHNGISVKTRQFRLTKYIEKDSTIYHLFDHYKDPEENFNIAPEKPEIVKKLIPILERGTTQLYQ